MSPLLLIFLLHLIATTTRVAICEYKRWCAMCIHRGLASKLISGADGKEVPTQATPMCDFLYTADATSPLSSFLLEYSVFDLVCAVHSAPHVLKAGIETRSLP